MDDSRWLRLIILGLVLAALAIGYFLISGRLSLSSIVKKPSPEPSVLGQNAEISPSTIPVPTPTPASAYSRIANRTQNQVQTLPNTGFPAGLAVAFSISAIISGWGLRKYPH